MGENDKPFACPLTECGMRFTNEDHLTVHKKKHDMCLSFGNGQKISIFVADQTPTPTRFIRNCEEVGLFQDLQNVNPFEEQFRKAAEAAKSGNTPLPSEVETLITDDTLHTPQVFSHIERPPAVAPRNNPEAAAPEERTKPQEQTKDSDVQLLLRLPDGKVVKLSAVEMKDSEATSAAPIHSSSILSTPSVIVDQPTTDGQTTRTVLYMGSATNKPSNPQASPKLNNDNKTSNADAVERMAVVKEKLKQTLSANRKSIHKPPEIKITPPVQQSKKLLAVPIPRHSAVVSKRPKASNSSTVRLDVDPLNLDDDPQVKRQKFLERNRAAASRCRQKRKNWVGMLEQRASVVNSTNQQLVAEVASLKEEVAQLKTLLLAHRDCPVTKAMCQAGVLRLIEDTSESTSTMLTTEVSSSEVTSAKTSMESTTAVTPGVIRILSTPSVVSSSIPPTLAVNKERPQSSLRPLLPVLPVRETAHIMCAPSKPHTSTPAPAPSYVITQAPLTIVTQQHKEVLVLKSDFQQETVIVKNNV